jgi:pimeloyl-ACP methyl ester carboxylesterase
VSLDESEQRERDGEGSPSGASVGAPADPERARAQALDADLEEIDWTVLPAGSTRSMFEAPSGPLAVVSLGDPSRPRVLLVPGVTGSKEDFTLLMPLLVEAGYYAQAYDLAGQFESAAAGPETGRHYDYELFIGDMIAFLESGAPAHLLGYSFAGTVAECVALRRPDLCLSLSLLVAPPLSGQVFRGVKWVGWFSGLAGGRASAAVMIWAVTWNLNRVSPMRIRFVRDRMRLTRRSSVSDVLDLMRHTPDLGADLARLELPKLVVAGKGDLWSVEQHRAFASKIRARAAIYSAGHRSPEMAPNELALDLVRLFETAR